MDRRYCVALPGVMLARPYGENFVCDSSNKHAFFVSPCIDIAIDFMTMCFAVSEFSPSWWGSVSFQCISPFLRFVPFLSFRLWLPFPDAIRVTYSVWGRMRWCHCHFSFVSWWMWCLLAIWCVGGIMWLALSAGIHQGYLPSLVLVRVRIQHHPVWQKLLMSLLAALAIFWYSTSCQCQCFKTASNVFKSQNHAADWGPENLQLNWRSMPFPYF